MWATPGRWLTNFEGVVRVIEREGFECVPYAPVAAPQMPRRPVRPGQCAPNGVRLSVEYAAAAAGLGVIGYHGMFLSARFGLRQRLGLLVTDLEIEPGPGPDAGSAAICAGCMECVKACPLEAISAVETVSLSCAGRRMTLGAIDADACRICPNGVSGDSQYFAGAEELHFDIENNQVKGERTAAYSRGALPNRLSAACGRACMAHFEATHDTGYRLPFRIREPWGFRPDRKKEW